jgi:hypothetical protein
MDYTATESRPLSQKDGDLTT